MASPHRPPQTPSTLHSRLLRQLQADLCDRVVLHHADHELQQLRVFCPQQNFTAALNTRQAPELFEPLPHLTPTNTHAHLAATIPSSLRSKYKWGFRKDFTIPYGIVHLKAKKKFGRRAVPSSPTTNPWLATSSASPVERSTSFSNTSSHSNSPSRNFGAISIPTSSKHQQTSPYMPPTTTWSVSSTQSPNNA